MSHQVEYIFESWARWCEAGQNCTQNQASMIARLIESKGHLVFCDSHFSVNAYCIEANVESALMSLFILDPLAVDVIRFEYIYSASFIENGATLNQARKADKMGISKSTYQRKITKCHQYVLDELNKYKKR